eukprot:5882958-Heterocapsa_arctica.AAC.1
MVGTHNLVCSGLGGIRAFHGEHIGALRFQDEKEKGKGQIKELGEQITGKRDHGRKLQQNKRADICGSRDTATIDGCTRRHRLQPSNIERVRDREPWDEHHGRDGVGSDGRSHQ